ncbi:MAG: hypothetical protein NXI08_00600 [bacterium]|nr:hypothetical protein [bacterium]
MLFRTFCFLIFILFCSNFVFSSCNTPTDTCGPFPTHYETTDFEVTISDITIHTEAGINITQNELNPDSVSVPRFSILMEPVKEYYFSKVAKNTPSRWTNSLLFACSPTIPTSEETIQSLSISSNLAFNAKTEAYEELIGYFDIITFSNYYGYQRYSYPEFIASKPTVPQALYFVLNTAPDQQKPMKFSVFYKQEGRSRNIFEFETQSVAITN